MGRPGREFRPVLRECNQSRALPFRHDGKQELERIELPEYTDEVWHGYLPDARPGRSMAIASMDPTSRTPAIALIPNKLLIDPYAKQLVGALSWGPELFGYRLDHPDKDKSFDERDSAPFDAEVPR